MSTDYPYNSYSSHTVLGMLYKQNDTKINEREVFGIDELKMIHSVIGFPHYNNLKTYKEYLESQANKISKL